MELTAHSGARPSHAEWQGQIVSRSGQDGYLSLDAIGYGTVTGFKGINCRHDWRPYYPGSPRTYTDEELEALKNETVMYNGKEISKYEATQIQRQLERQIRKNKNNLAGLQGILTSGITDNELIKNTRTDFAKTSLIYNTNKAKLDDFISQTALKLDSTRLYTGKTINSQVYAVTKIANRYNNSDIVGTIVNGVEITEISEHIISRTYARDLEFDDIYDTLKNPVGYGKIRKDDSQQIKGKNCTVAINVKTGKLITAFGKKNN